MYVCYGQRGTEGDFVCAHLVCARVRECVTKQERGLIRLSEGLKPR